MDTAAGGDTGTHASRAMDVGTGAGMVGDPQPTRETDAGARPEAIGIRTGLVLAIVGACALAVALIAFQGSRGAGYDFAAYDAAARRLAAGQPLYQPGTQSGPFAPGPAGFYLYPPPLAVLLLALVPLGTSLAASAWQTLHIAALVAACAVMPVPRPVRLAAFGVAGLSLPTLLDLNLGNVSLFVLLAASIAWRWREEAPAGVATATAVAVRPQVALLLAWWAWRRQVRPLAWAALAGGIVVVGSAAIAGIGGWEGYLRLLGNLRGAGTASSDAGLASTVLRGGFAEPLPTLAFAAGAVAGIVGVVFSTRRDPDAGFVSGVCATLLVVPLLWPHYLVLLLLPAAVLAARGHAWGLALPLLGWLPGPMLPLVALAGCWAPGVVRPTNGLTPPPGG